MATKLSAILMMVFCTVLTSAAQVFYKKGSALLSFNLMSIITNYNILIGLILYITGGVIMIYAFKHGEVTVLYPVITLSYVWVSLLSVYFFNEIMTFYKWLGVIVIIIGIIFIGFGGKKSESLNYAGVTE
ncbi:MAG: EamA family transporter [Nanoarchaeota archaeon]|nr:EamA family transporter [Nanoarchaeota archaeon]